MTSLNIFLDVCSLCIQFKHNWGGGGGGGIFCLFFVTVFGRLSYSVYPRMCIADLLAFKINSVSLSVVLNIHVLRFVFVYDIFISCCTLPPKPRYHKINVKSLLASDCCLVFVCLFLSFYNLKKKCCHCSLFCFSFILFWFKNKPLHTG